MFGMKIRRADTFPLLSTFNTIKLSSVFQVSLYAQTHNAIFPLLWELLLLPVKIFHDSYRISIFISHLTGRGGAKCFSLNRGGDKAYHPDSDE